MAYYEIMKDLINNDDMGSLLIIWVLFRFFLIIDALLHVMQVLHLNTLGLVVPLSPQLLNTETNCTVQPPLSALPSKVLGTVQTLSLVSCSLRPRKRGWALER